MSTPTEPPGSTDPGGTGPYGPTAFWSDEHPPVDLLTQVNDTLPGSTPGGLIEAVKRAVVTGLRDAVTTADLQVNGSGISIDLEYPLEEERYPGIWVQFSITKFTRAGIGQEVAYQDPNTGTWTPIQTFTFSGRVTLSIVALTNKDRDQLADSVIAMLAFTRTPEVWVTQPSQDTKQYRGLLASLDNNPFVSLTLNTDVINCGGQGVEVGVPWQPDKLAYTDNYSFDLLGQTQIRFMHDGAYTLSNVNYVPIVVTSVPEQDVFPIPVTYPPIGRGVSEETLRTL
jgi:hypothetical protein